MSTMTRGEFLKLLGTGVAAAALSACDDGGGAGKPDAAGPDAPAGCTMTNAKTVIADNHVHAPHVLVVSKEDVAAAVEKTYDIMGSASHTHMITVTAEQFTMLKSAASIMVTSTVGFDHTHLVTISC
jgi:hypothetical protein